MTNNDKHMTWNSSTSSLLTSLVGRKLHQVQYRLLPSSSEMENSTDAIDVVDIGVELIFRDQQISFLWVMDGSTGVLALYQGEPGRPDLASKERVDAAKRQGWSRRIQREVVRCGIALHFPVSDYPDTLWSVRFEFADAKPAVVALGELIDGQPAYAPDTLLVLFDEEHAREYQVEESLDSAWGVNIEALPEFPVTLLPRLLRLELPRSVLGRSR